jgi:hypothetical protein
MTDSNARVITIDTKSAAVIFSSDVARFDTGRYIVDIRKWKPRRSLDQNAYFHALCGEIARLTGMDRDLIKEGLKEQYGVKVEYKGRRINRPSHLMDSAEIGDLIRGAEIELADAGGDHNTL